MQFPLFVRHLSNRLVPCFSTLGCLSTVKLPGHRNPCFSVAKSWKDTTASWLPSTQLEALMGIEVAAYGFSG